MTLSYKLILENLIKFKVNFFRAYHN